MLLKKITYSLAFRLPVLYKYWLSYKRIKIRKEKETGNSVVLTMTGSGLITMTRLSLLSIAKTWDKLPKVIVVTDGSISPEKVCSELKFWPGELVTKEWAGTEQYHLEKGRPAMAHYAKKNVLGKKLAVILHYAELHPLVWVDSDILFYNDFTRFIPEFEGFVCAGSEEGYSLYDPRVLDFFENDLYKRYNFSSGLLLIGGANIYETFNLEKLLEPLSVDYEHYFTEQSIFAHICSQSLGIIWKTDLVKNFHTDNTEIKAMSVSGVVARHYTRNVRHLFWRDAFFNL